ncbi:MAG: hypothetical protein ACRDYD_10090 [Acidimicrobiales bacterium]
MSRRARSPRTIREALVVSVLIVAGGMAYSLAWGPLVRHQSAWVTPGDLWATMRSASWVGWGAAGKVYEATTGLIALPGLPVALAPVALLAGALHLSSAFPFPVPHPTAWLLAGPVALALGSLPVFAVESLAHRVGVTVRRRRVLLAAVGALCWPAVAIWGHPEDTLALALALWAFAAAWRGRWWAVGWLAGVAFAVQPLVLLVLPMLAAVVVRAAGWREAGRAGARAAVLPAALVALTLYDAPQATIYALLHQPNWPTLDWPTPWVYLAPHLAGSAVAAGPGRMISIAVALGLGAWLLRRRAAPTPAVVLWTAGVALAGRCLFEAVMVPYYVMPAVVVLVVVTALYRPTRLWWSLASGGFLTIYTFWHWVPWPWYAEVTILLGCLVWLAAPGKLARGAAPRLGGDPAPAKPAVGEAVVVAALPADPAPAAGRPNSGQAPVPRQAPSRARS